MSCSLQQIWGKGGLIQFYSDIFIKIKCLSCFKENYLDTDISNLVIRISDGWKGG